MATATPSVRFFSPEHPALPRTVRAKLEQRRAELCTQLGSGYAADWPDYKERVGIIRGIEDAIAICSDAEKELQE